MLPEEFPDQFLDPGVDIRAIEGRDPCVYKLTHISNCLSLVNMPVTARQLPPALDDLRDGIAVPECGSKLPQIHPFKRPPGARIQKIKPGKLTPLCHVTLP